MNDTDEGGSEHEKEVTWQSDEDASGGTCKSSRRCLEHLWFDVMYRGSRFRMPVNEFAVPRMEPGKQRPIESMEEARDWERLFIGEIKAGRDPAGVPDSIEVKATRTPATWRLPRRVRGALREAGGSGRVSDRSAAASPCSRRTSASCRSMR